MFFLIFIFKLLLASGGNSISLPSVDLSSLVEVAKIAIPAFVAWSAAYLSSKKQERERQDSQQDKLLGEMTAQSRDMINRLQLENSEERERTQAANERVARVEIESKEKIAKLETELAETRKKYEESLELLKTKRSRRPRGEE